MIFLLYILNIIQIDIVTKLRRISQTKSSHTLDIDKDRQTKGEHKVNKHDSDKGN